MNYPYYEVRFDDHEHVVSFQTLEEARQYRSKNNWRYMSRWLQVVEHNQDSKGYPISKVIIG